MKFKKLRFITYPQIGWILIPMVNIVTVIRSNCFIIELAFRWLKTYYAIAVTFNRNPKK